MLINKRPVIGVPAGLEELAKATVLLSVVKEQHVSRAG